MPLQKITVNDISGGVSNTSITGTLNGNQISANTITSTNLQTNSVENYMSAQGSTFSFRNKAINGAFDIWQRGTSFTDPGTNYTADRFHQWGGGTGTVVSRQSFSLTDTLGNDPAPAYFYRYAAASFAGAGDIGIIGQRIEDWKQFLGKKVTVSFWYRRPAGVIVNDGLLLQLKRSSSFYDNCMELSISAPPVTSGSSWAYYSGTFTVPANAASGQTMTSTASMAFLWYYQQCPLSGNIDIANFQIEIGSVATPFERRPYATELALCQRYYETSFNPGVAPANGVYTNAYLAHIGYTDQWTLTTPIIQYKTPKRATPTVNLYGGSGGTWQMYNPSTGWATWAAAFTPSSQGGQANSAYGFSMGIHNNGNSGLAVGTSRAITGDWTASAEI